MPRVHRAFSVLQHRVTQPTAETAAGCESGHVRWGVEGRQEEKKEVSVRGCGGALLPFCETTGGGLNVARKLAS